jgi:TonB family protein
VVDKVAPVYPDLAKRMHITGVVKLEVVVRANGSVRTTKVVGGNPVLIQSATDAVRKWKFETASEETTGVVELMFDPH